MYRKFYVILAVYVFYLMYTMPQVFVLAFYFCPALNL